MIVVTMMIIIIIMTMMIIVLIKSSQVMLSQIIRMDAALNDNVCRIRRIITTAS